MIAIYICLYFAEHGICLLDIWRLIHGCAEKLNVTSLVQRCISLVRCTHPLDDDELNTRRETLCYCVYLVNILLTIRSRPNSRFKKRMRCHLESIIWSWDFLPFIYDFIIEFHNSTTRYWKRSPSMGNSVTP